MRLRKTQQKIGSKYVHVDIQKAADVWCEFDSSLSETECKACRHYILQSKGGRPRRTETLSSKRKHDIHFDHIESSDVSFSVDSTDTACTSTPIRTRRTVETETETYGVVAMLFMIFT